MSSAALVLVLPVLLSTAGDAPDAGARDPLVTMSPLLGKWVAEPDPKQPGVTGWTTFERGLGDRVVVRRNHASYPARDGKPAAEHDDLMVVFVDDGKLRAAVSTTFGLGDLREAFAAQQARSRPGKVVITIG